MKQVNSLAETCDKRKKVTACTTCFIYFKVKTRYDTTWWPKTTIML